MSAPLYVNAHGDEVALDPRQVALVETVLAMATKARRLERFQVTLNIAKSHVKWVFSEMGETENAEPSPSQLEAMRRMLT